MALSQVFLRYSEQIEAEMRQVVDSRPLPLYRMMSYHMGWIDDQGNRLNNNGGERILSTLCLLACEAAGGNLKTALPAAVAVELVYNFSLIHNDLQDGNPQRQGRDTVWWLWGPAQAINAGDGMHALARLSLFWLKDMGVSDETVFRAIQILDEASLRLCEGQFLDISYQERIDVGVKTYLNMIEDRTGALMRCSLKLGALLASARADIIDALELFGNKLGLASQIRDDIVGLWGDRSSEGIPSSNILNKKKTLPVVYGLEKADVKDKRRLGEVYFKRVLEPQDVEQIAKLLDGVGAREYCQEMAEMFYSEALQALDDSGLPLESTRELREAAQYLVYDRQ